MEKLKISFNSVQVDIDEFLENEGISLDKELRNNLLIFLSKICVYEEEEVKIRPNIILCKDIRAVAEGVTNSEIVKLSVGEIDGGDMNKILKSIVPFCNNNWIVYIDLDKIEKQEIIEYGIIRSFNGITGIPFVENVTEINPEDIGLINYKFIEIKVLSNFEVQLQGLKSQTLVIDFRIHNESELFPNDVTRELIEDIISDYKLEEVHGTRAESIDISDLERTLFNSYSNFLKLLAQKVYGTILLVVKDGFQPNDSLKDGIWLEDPINLSDLAINAGAVYKDIVSNEVFYAYSSLLIEMLNIDGITVINSKGQILGYNVFISQSLSTVDSSESGGARRRAATSLLTSDEEKIIGVYFQSQDGHAFYKRRN